MPPSLRPNVTPPESTRGGVVVASLDEHVVEADRACAEAHVALVGNTPGAALFAWGPDAVCLAYNRAFRSLAALRVNAAGKPLLRTQPDLERALRPRIELALAGTPAALDGAAFAGGPEGVKGETHLGWLLPVAGPSGARGVLAMLMDAGAFLEPTRRLVGALAADLREPLVGIQVVSERLSRIPKPTRERCVEDMDRVLDHSRVIDRLIEDMGAFARRTSLGGAARLSLRPGDLGTIVRLACERLEAGKGPPLRVNVVEASGMWDDEAILRILTTIVASARQANDAVNVVVELGVAGREAAILTIKDDGPPLRSEDAELLFEPWRRGLAPGVERRRRGLGLGLYLARELVQAHGGRVVGERPTGGGFAVRLILPILSSGGSVPSSRTYRTFG